MEEGPSGRTAGAPPRAKGRRASRPISAGKSDSYAQVAQDRNPLARIPVARFLKASASQPRRSVSRAAPTIPQMDERPIGVFDSGMGGLTVLHECLVTLPHEDFVYLGDAARLPYGPRP